MFVVCCVVGLLIRYCDITCYVVYCDVGWGV